MSSSECVIEALKVRKTVDAQLYRISKSIFWLNFMTSKRQNCKKQKVLSFGRHKV